MQKDGKVGLIDELGNEIVSCRYDSIGQFHEGVALVKISGGTYGDTRYGYITAEGKEVIPCEYMTISAFTNNLASGTKENRDGSKSRYLFEIIN